jgi:parallel beta-helix repeat protein
VYRNDFSHAAANGIEATFSKGNRFIENILDECEHGVWAGYSTHSVISGNIIRHCRNGVSIEHGRDNRIMDNTIEDDEQGVHLWWDNDEDLLAGAFCKANDTCPSTTTRRRIYRGSDRHPLDRHMSASGQHRTETPIRLQGGDVTCNSPMNPPCAVVCKMNHE